MTKVKLYITSFEIVYKEMFIKLIISIFIWSNFIWSNVNGNTNIPVCIIGGGVTGMTLAQRFDGQGISSIVFDEQPFAGGKAVTWRHNNGEYLVDLGPLLFSKESYNSMNVFKLFGARMKPVPHTEYTAFKPGTNLTRKYPSIDYSELRRRYLIKRSQVDLSPGYLNTNPDLFVSLGEWLIKNELKEFIPISQLLVTVCGYGSVFETPALYGLNIIDEHGDLNEPLYIVVDGLDQVFLTYSKGINMRLRHRITKLEPYQNYVKLHFQNNNMKGTQTCRKVITAFPPLHETMTQLINNTKLLSALEPVVVSKYATFVTYNPHLTDFAYFATLDPTQPYPQEPPGNGHVTGLLRQRNAYASYAWYSGASKSLASLSEYQTMYKTLQQDLSILTNSSLDTTVISGYRNWAYFPHVTTSSLHQNFYKNLHEVQGTDNIYIAGTIHSFETIHHAINGAHYFFDKYFKKS